MMYFRLPLLALLFCGLSTCVPDKRESSQQNVISTASYVASPDQDTASYVPLYIHDIPFEEQLNQQVTDFGAYGQVLVPPIEQFETQVLNRGTWVWEHYVDGAASIPQRKAGTGQWLRFRPDGTFTGGHWDRQTHAGAYYLDFQLKYPRLTLDSNVDRLDAVWEIQGVNGDQDAMSWRRVNDSGFGPFKKGSVLCKLIQLTDLPTKQQFAGQFAN